MYKVKSNGDCLPSSLAAVIIDLFQREKLNAQFAAKVFDPLIQQLCIAENIRWQTDASTSFKAFLNKYHNDPDKAQEKFDGLIRKYTSRLMQNKKEEIVGDDIGGIFPDLLREWNLVCNGTELNSGDHIFHGIQGYLKTINSREDLKRYLKTGGGFEHYIESIGKDGEYLNAVPAVHFLTHLRLNFTAEIKPRDTWQSHHYVSGFKNTLTITLKCVGRHWYPNQSARFDSQNEISDLIENVRRSKANFGKSSKTGQDFFENNHTKSLLKNGMQYDFEEKEVKRTRKLVDGEKEQIKKDRELAYKLQREEFDAFDKSVYKSFNMR